MLTADEQMRGGRTIALKAAVDEALEMGGCDSVRKVVVYKRTGGNVKWDAARDLWLDDLVAGQPETCEPEWVGAEHPLFVLYTSGSTGTPKGIQHSTGGYLLWAILTMKWVFDHKPTDVSGAPPTWAGSPATRTYAMGRSRAEQRRSYSKACPPTPTPGASGK